MNKLSVHTRRVWTCLMAGLLVFGLAGTLAASSQAQGLPPICEDYPNLDICIGPVADDTIDGDEDPITGGDDVGPGGNGNGDGDGSLPFTGYPLTDLMLLLVALLATGLLIRAGLAARDRFARNSSS